MKVTKQVILLGTIALLAGLAATWFLLKKKAEPGPASPTPVIVNTRKAVPNAARPDEEKYYRAHPYLQKAEEMNDANLYDSAIYYYQAAAFKFEKEKEWRGYVWSINYVAKLYLFVRDKNYLQALPFLKKAIAREKAVGSEHPFMATTYFYLGLYYYNEKQTEQALTFYQKSLSVRVKNYGEQHLEVAEIYNAIGDVHYYLLYNGQVAEKNYAKSLRIKEAVAGKTEPSLIYSYYNLLNINMLIGDYAEAESYGYEAIKSLPYVNNNRIYWTELLEAVMANIYVEQNKLKIAKPKLHNAIALNLKNGGNQGYLSFYYNSLGEVYNRTANPDSAVFYFKKAINIYNAGSGTNPETKETATTYFNLGVSYLKQNRYQVALTYLKKCLNTRTKIYGIKHLETAVTLQHLAMAYQKANLPDSSLVYLQRAVLACTQNYNPSNIFKVPLVSQINTSYHSFQIIKDKAALLKNLYLKDSTQLNYLQASLQYYLLTDSLLTSFRSEYDRESSKLNYLRNNNNIYEEAIDCAGLLYKKNNKPVYLDYVFRFMDKQKSSLLLEALHEQDQLKKLNIPEKEYQGLLSAQRDLRFLQSHLDEQNAQEAPNEATLRLLHAKIFATEKKLRSMQEKLNQRFLPQNNAGHNPDTIRLADLQAFSRRHKAAILEYFWGDSAVYILGIYQNKTALLKVTQHKFLETQINQLHQQLVQGYQVETSAADFASFSTSAANIFNLVVKPAFYKLGLPNAGSQENPALIIIPDGLLSFVSFEILISKNANNQEANYKHLDYLIKSYVISYNYSGRLLLKNYYEPKAVKSARLLAFSFSDNQAGKSYPEELNNRRTSPKAELPGSAQELNAIATYMKGHFYAGEAATEDVFKKEAPQYDILHLAVHGEANTTHTFDSRLIFKPQKNSLNDGILNVYELYGLKMNAQLAVLSACESGLGKYNAGEGVYSIARGFINAGCSAVVMSYWRVNDQATATLMANFYQALSAGSTIHTSIRTAKLAYLQNADRRTAHPANWAAFVAMGNMNPVVKTGFFTTLIPWAIGMLVLILAGYYWLKNTKPKPQKLETKLI